MSAEHFDRARYQATLSTRTLGRSLLVREEATSTNDVAWEAMAQRAPDGTAVVAERQSAGRGRAGRTWSMAPGKGLALSVALIRGCERDDAGLLPLAAGLALARALERLGVRAELKWPNDLLVRDRKLSGILCESRRLARGNDLRFEEAFVVGVGVNVLEEGDDFPPELRERATSMRQEGSRAGREETAAEFLNAFEPLWITLAEGDRGSIPGAWQERAGFWGRRVTVRDGSGERGGIARRLSAEGGLVLELEDRSEVTVIAADLDWSGSETRR